jgi:HTH-like domain
MVAYIDAHRDRFGVEPICSVLPIAPSTYHRHRQHQVDPARRSARAHRDDTLRVEIQRVYDEHHHVYGPRKVWKQLRREGIRAARCTVGRLMPRWTVQKRQLIDSQNRQFLRAAETGEFYFAPSSVRKSVWTLVRQLRGPHLSTCA